MSVRTGTLTAAERQIINHHIEITIEMLESLPWPHHLENVPEYAGGHHERMDGAGYPAGLIASEIPLASRIIAVCSTYDSMTKRETYGPPMDGEEAVAELRTIAGTQLDPELVETFITLLERHGSAFGRDADYKTELEFDTRVRKMAQPHASDTATFARAPAAMRLRRRR